MSINFIPNDPLAQGTISMRRENPLPERPDDLAGFKYKDPMPPEGVYDFGTKEFLFWQCRQAALYAIKMWEVLNGSLPKWSRSDNPTKLRLIQNYAFNQLNAEYTGNSLLFYIFKTQDDKTTYAAASTDVVSHEAGHAFLDVIRPDLWTSALYEAAAFHEAFADCMSLLTALADPKIRSSALPSLNSPNLVETMGEDIADGLRRLYESIPEGDPQRGSLENATGPRQALNDFKWQLPESLDPVGPPRKLVSEIHSFSRLFTGCFYDTFSGIFASLPTQDERALWAAAQTAGRLLIAGARSAPENPRFFREVGRGMVLADELSNGGANRRTIRNAFERHGIALGSAAMLAPVASLAGTAPKLAVSTKGPVLAAGTRKDLLGRINASPHAKLNVSVINIAGTQLAQALHRREVSLGKLDKRLKGVVAFGAEPVLVGAVGNKAAILGSLPQVTTTNEAVLFFVESLLNQDSILFDKISVKATAETAYCSPPKTHVVRKRGGKKVLTRLGFSCKPGFATVYQF